MEKEDILAESRKENQGKDPQEKPVVDHGNRHRFGCLYLPYFCHLLLLCRQNRQLDNGHGHLWGLHGL